MIKVLLYQAIFLIWAVFVSICALPTLLLPLWGVMWMTRVWARGVVFFSRVLFGIKWEVRGAENIPKGACIVAANHQSLWETCVLYLVLDKSLYVLKKELAGNPLWGGYMVKIGCIPVDRSAGIAALKKLTQDACTRLSEGRQVIIFPEGTRIAPGEHGEFQAGIAAIYTKADVPVLTMAHNAGMCIPKKGAIRSGKIIFQFMPPIEAGLKRKEFMAVLEKTINDGADEIYAEAMAEREAGK